MKEAMLEVGYSENTATVPGNVTNSKGWAELLNEVMPDTLLAKVHVEGLSAMKRSTSLTEPDKVDPDYAVRAKYLEMGYKVKDKFPKEANVQVQILNTIQDKQKDYGFA